jgi:hypothetical protein
MSIAVHLSNLELSDGTCNIVVKVRAEGKIDSRLSNLITYENNPLAAPTISLDGDILTMVAADETAKQFVICVDGVEKAVVEADGAYYNTEFTSWRIKSDADFSTLGYDEYQVEFIASNNSGTSTMGLVPFTANGLKYAEMDGIKYVDYIGSVSDPTTARAVTIENGITTWSKDSYRYITIVPAFSTIERGLQLFNWLQKNATYITFPELLNTRWIFYSSLNIKWVYLYVNIMFDSSFNEGVYYTGRKATQISSHEVSNYYFLSYYCTDRRDNYGYTAEDKDVTFYSDHGGWLLGDQSRVITITDSTHSILRNNGALPLLNALEWLNENAATQTEEV